MDRRRFLQLTAASMAMMGLAACGPEVAPRDRQPYVEQPAGIVPGRWRYFATATALQGYGTGVLVKHEMGRPLKIEGNPDHPASLGATSAIGQASILELYNPFRARHPDAGRRDRAVVRVHDGSHRAAAAVARRSRSRPRAAHRHRDLAHAARADRRAAARLSRSSPGISGKPSTASRREPARSSRTDVRSICCPIFPGRCHPRGRERLPRVRTRPSALRAGLCVAAPARRR